jgi:hypothetical protein
MRVAHLFQLSPGRRLTRPGNFACLTSGSWTCGAWVLELTGLIIFAGASTVAGLMRGVVVRCCGDARCADPPRTATPELPIGESDAHPDVIWERGELAR